MIGETVTVTRRIVDGGEDSQGNPTTTESTFTIDGCAYAPNTAEEDLATFGTRDITGGTLYAPTGTVLLAGDLVEIRGDLFGVEGGSSQWTDPYANEGKGVTVSVRRSA